MIDTSLNTPCLFNFVVFAPNPTRGSYLAKLVDIVMQRFPCRVQFIRLHEGSTPLEIVKKTAGIVTNSMNCDYIELNANSKDIAQTPFYILPHLVPDRPVFLLWGQDPLLDNQIFPMISQYADRIIFDSDCSENLSNFCVEIAKISASNKHSTLDLNWARIAGWKEITSSIFNTEEKVNDLANAKDIHITYNIKKDTAIQHQELPALYFQSWLSSRLGWKYFAVRSQNHPIEIVYGTKESTLNVRLTSTEISELPAGALVEVEVESPNQHLYHLECKPHLPKQVKVHISSAYTCEMPFTLPLLTQGWGMTFVKEILFSPTSHHYRDMLHALGNVEL